MPASSRYGSFRGVPFSLEQHEGEGGRRVAKKEFPGKDTPYSEDLGGISKVFTLEAFVISTDQEQRDGTPYQKKLSDLLDALDKPGPGKLVHPYRGEMTVQVETYSYTETSANGGMATLTIKFGLTEAVTYPMAVNNYVDQAAETASTAQAVAAEEFASSMIAIGSLDPTTTAATVSTLQKLSKAYQDALGNAAKMVKAAEKFSKNVNDMAINAQAMLTAPIGLAFRVAAVFNSLLGSGDYLKNIFKAYSRLFKKIEVLFAGKSYSSSASGTRQKAVDLALKKMISLMLVSSMARAATAAKYSAQVSATNSPTLAGENDSIPFSTIDNLERTITTKKDVDAIRETLIQRIEEQQEDTTSDQIFNLLQGLKISALKTVPAENEGVKNTKKITLPTDQPALVVAWNKYKSLDMLDDLIARNAVRNPNAVSGGKEIEVIE